VKLITAIIQPDMLDDAMQAAVAAGARGMTVTEVRGFGQQYGYREHAARPARQQALILPKVRIDTVVQDEDAGAVADVMAKSVRSGAIGDGKIWICDVERVLRVRTGDRDRDAV
jgi:nitrogen regulatory protein P-II 1